MPQDVHNNTQDSQFELKEDGFTGKIEYRLKPGRIIFTHTEVPEQLAGRGIASKLAKAALQHARVENLRVVPLCPFVAAYIRKHDEYADLVADGA